MSYMLISRFEELFSHTSYYKYFMSLRPQI